MNHSKAFITSAVFAIAIFFGMASTATYPAYTALPQSDLQIAGPPNIIISPHFTPNGISAPLTGEEACDFNARPYTRCTIEENEFLQFDITFIWGEGYPPNLPMCVWANQLPLGATAPQAQGIGQATITTTWTPNFCQSKYYGLECSPGCFHKGAVYDIGISCPTPSFADPLFFYPVDFNVSNVNRQPVLQVNPVGPLDVFRGDFVHIDVNATDADALECTADSNNMDKLKLSHLEGFGSFFDLGNGNALFDWFVDADSNTNLTFTVNDGRGGSDESVVFVNFLGGAVDTVLAEPNGVKKNRYISFVPSNAGRSVALRVKLASLYHPQAPVGQQPDFSSFEGQYRWVGAPRVISDLPGTTDPLSTPTSTIAQLQCTPQFLDWSTINVLHAFGEEIVPSSIYEVQAIAQDCSPLNEHCFSDPLVIQTSKWGDIVGVWNGSGWNPSNGVIDISDTVAALNKFENKPGSPLKVITDIHSKIPNKIIDILDIVMILDAFVGKPYPNNITTSCNPLASAQTSNTVTVQKQATTFE